MVEDIASASVQRAAVQYVWTVRGCILFLGGYVDLRYPISRLTSFISSDQVQRMRSRLPLRL